jgi:LCP family protein required for cell wall assembly
MSELPPDDAPTPSGAAAPLSGWRRLRWRRVVVIVAGLCVVVVATVLIIGTVLFGQIHRVNIRFTAPQGTTSSAGTSAPATTSTTSASPSASPAAGSENFLLMGSDSRDFAGGQAYNVAPGSAAFVTGQRSDVVMLVHIPAGTAKATVVSFPRDSWVDLPAYTDTNNVAHPAVYAKLNAAFSIGGAPLLVATVEQLTGLHIDHFASVNFPGFQGMVNALGGIDVCIGTTRHDTNSGDFLTAGEHHINGVQALALVRDRESFPNEDLERIKDQEYFLSVMLRKVLSAGTLTNPLKLTEFLNVATKSLTVDSGLSLGDMRKLASRFSHLDPTHVTFLTVPIANANYRATSSVYGNQPQDNVELDPAGMAALFASLESDTGAGAATSSSPTSPLASPTDVQVSVENGTSRNGLARTTAAELQALGFHVNAVGDVPSDSSVTTISYSAADLAAAESLQSHVPGATLLPVTTPGLVLTLGANFTDITPAPATLPVASAAAPNLTCAP